MSQLLTDIADGYVTIPMALAVALIMLIARQWRPGLGWVLGIGGVWTAILLLKFAGYAIVTAWPDSVLGAIDLVTPSGHVASATVVYGGLAGLLFRWPGSLRLRALTVAVVLAAMVGFTRVRLDYHSVAEVVIGGGVGIAGVAVLAQVARTALPWPLPLPILAAAVLILFAGYGTHLSFEGVIRHAAAEAIGAWRPSGPALPHAPVFPSVSRSTTGGR